MKGQRQKDAAHLEAKAKFWSDVQNGKTKHKKWISHRTEAFFGQASLFFEPSLALHWPACKALGSGQESPRNEEKSSSHGACAPRAATNRQPRIQGVYAIYACRALPLTHGMRSCETKQQFCRCPFWTNQQSSCHEGLYQMPSWNKTWTHSAHCPPHLCLTSHILTLQNVRFWQLRYVWMSKSLVIPMPVKFLAWHSAQWFTKQSWKLRETQNTWLMKQDQTTISGKHLLYNFRDW